MPSARPGCSSSALGHPGLTLRVNADRGQMKKISRLQMARKMKDKKIKAFIKNGRLEAKTTLQSVKRGERVPIQALSRALRRKTPASEKWFQFEWKRSGMIHSQDLFNYVSGPFIPDLINHNLKYLVEVDGSIHRNSLVQQKDTAKQKYFEDKGFSVFRVKAFDHVSLAAAINAIRESRRNGKAHTSGCGVVSSACQGAASGWKEVPARRLPGAVSNVWKREGYRDCERRASEDEG